jgi:hypothetical protein
MGGTTVDGTTNIRNPIIRNRDGFHDCHCRVPRGTAGSFRFRVVPLT